MGWHLLASLVLAIIGTIITAALGFGTGTAAVVGLIVFGLYWGVCVIWVNLEDVF